MLPSLIRRVLVAQHRTDFRKRFDGLLGEAYRLGADPYSGDCVVFIKSDHTQIRAIVGDRLGLYMVCRRFEGEKLRVLVGAHFDPGVGAFLTHRSHRRRSCGSTHIPRVPGGSILH